MDSTKNTADSMQEKRPFPSLRELLEDKGEKTQEKEMLVDAINPFFKSYMDDPSFVQAVYNKTGVCEALDSLAPELQKRVNTCEQSPNNLYQIIQYSGDASEKIKAISPAIASAIEDACLTDRNLKDRSPYARTIVWLKNAAEMASIMQMLLPGMVKDSVDKYLEKSSNSAT